MKGYPNWTAITRIVERGETPVFKQYFTSWIDYNDQKGLGNVYNIGNIAGESRMFELYKRTGMWFEYHGTIS